MPNQQENPILIVGGYGVVGLQIAAILRERHPTMPLLLAGREPKRARASVEALGRAQAIALDLGKSVPLAGLTVKPAAVIGVANDPHDHLLLDCVRRGVPLIDITRWTERVSRGLASLALETLSAPVILSSGWMGGSIALIVSGHRHHFSTLERVDIDVLFAVADKAGPNSVEYMDRLTMPFSTNENGRTVQRHPLTDAKVVTFMGGYRGKVYRFDTPDQFSLPLTSGVATVNARIGFDDVWTQRALIALRRAGILKLLGHPRFDRLRHGLLFNPGPGAPHEVNISLWGIDQEQPLNLRIMLRDRRGQTHLTACGAVAQLEWALGLRGGEPAPAGIWFAEQHGAAAATLEFLREREVEIRVEQTEV